MYATRALVVPLDPVPPDLARLVVAATDEGVLPPARHCAKCAGILKLDERTVCAICFGTVPRVSTRPAPEPTVACLVCGDTSQGLHVCGWCQREPVGSALARLIGTGRVDTEAWTDLIGAIRGTVDTVDEDLVSELREAEETISDLRAQLLAAQDALIAKAVECEGLRARLMDEVEKSPEVMAVKLFEAGAINVVIRYSAGERWPDGEWEASVYGPVIPKTPPAELFRGEGWLAKALAWLKRVTGGGDRG